MKHSENVKHGQTQTMLKNTYEISATYENNVRSTQTMKSMVKLRQCLNIHMKSAYDGQTQTMLKYTYETNV